VHEGVEAWGRLRYDVAPEGSEIVGARVSRRHTGGGALVGGAIPCFRSRCEMRGEAELKVQRS